MSSPNRFSEGHKKRSFTTRLYQNREGRATISPAFAGTGPSTFSALWWPSLTNRADPPAAWWLLLPSGSCSHANRRSLARLKTSAKAQQDKKTFWSIVYKPKQIPQTKLSSRELIFFFLRPLDQEFSPVPRTGFFICFSYVRPQNERAPPRRSSFWDSPEQN